MILIKYIFKEYFFWFSESIWEWLWSEKLNKLILHLKAFVVQFSKVLNKAKVIFIELLVIIEFYLWLCFGWSWRLLPGSKPPAFFYFFPSHPLLSVCLMTWNRDYAIFCNWKLWDRVFLFKQFYVLMVVMIVGMDSDYILFLLLFYLLFLVLLFFLLL